MRWTHFRDCFSMVVCYRPPERFVNFTDLRDVDDIIMNILSSREFACEIEGSLFVR